MKFPLSRAPFGNYPALSEAQSRKIESIVQQTLLETVGEYEVHQQKKRRVLPRSHYKVVKKVENLICYRQRLVHGNANDVVWRIPKIVTIGVMVGTLDDVMYGLLATDATSTFIRASYTNEELLDSELLHCIESPTIETPFQFCGVKWHVLELTKIATKRDFVFVEATGIIVRPNGERIGYHIMHSVDLPELGELSEKYQVLRARVVTCNLFRQLSNNTIDVYMTGLVDPNGHMMGAVATTATVRLLLRLGQAFECSHSKKLEYLLEQQQKKRANHFSRSNGLVAFSRPNEALKPCAVCTTTLHMFRSVARCELCSEAVCSRCRVTRRLSYRVARPKELKQQNTIFCTACVAKGSIYSAVSVARAELQLQSSFRKIASIRTNNLVSTQLRRFLISSSISSNTTALSSSTYSRFETPVETDENLLNLTTRQRNRSSDDLNVPARKRSLTHPPVANDKAEMEKLTELDLCDSISMVSSSSDYMDEEFDENDVDTRQIHTFSDLPEFDSADKLAISMPMKPYTSESESHERRQRELMRRMVELRQNAESVYQLTQRNTQSMWCSGVPSISQSVYLTNSVLDIDLD
ncbi:unnamed protein product [Peronospora belbahrii]|uniref:FYVE-type domain-containing protein n=1 Tax=Peronospora belbahrii TaxID=622444 RepID=A0AAU9KFV3_9STRA|nr:unnamed protein product [Peronospora belbahrii]